MDGKCPRCGTEMTTGGCLNPKCSKSRMLVLDVDTPETLDDPDFRQKAQIIAEEVVKRIAPFVTAAPSATDVLKETAVELSNPLLLDDSDISAALVSALADARLLQEVFCVYIGSDGKAAKKCDCKYIGATDKHHRSGEQSGCCEARSIIGVLETVQSQHGHAPAVDLNKLREALADVEHERWSGWMIHMFDNQTPENIERWKRQMVTPYSELPEHSKDMDRKEANITLSVLKKFGLVRCTCGSEGKCDRRKKCSWCQGDRLPGEKCACTDAS